MFNEITKKGVLAAMEHPTTINKQMVDAQQARRVLDRLVGYKISPLLWDKVRRGLSAGRVQSVALKLVVDREREIERFVAEEYWNITAHLAAKVPPEFDARLLKKDGANIKVGNETEANAILADLKQARLDRQRRHDKGAEEERRSSVHHEQAPAGRAVSRQEDDDGRAAALRGRRASGRRVRRFDYLHANRLDPRVGSGADGCPRVHRAAVWRGVRAREADFLSSEGGCAGRARGDPSDVDAVPPGGGPGAPDAGPVLRLQVDLEPLRRVADAAGDVRRDDSRHQRRGVSLPGQRLRAQVRGLDGCLQPGRIAARRAANGRAGARFRHGGGRRGDGRAARAQRRRSARAEGAQAGTEVHAAAAALQRSDAGEGAWRRTASAARARTRRSSA